MKFPVLASSLLALALFAGPGHAGSPKDPGALVVAQADEADDAAQGNDRIAAIEKFLKVKRPASKFPDEALAKRLKRAKAFLKTPNLSAELQSGLEAEVAELEAESQKRASGGGSTAAAGEQPAKTADATDTSQDQMDSGAGQDGAAKTAEAGGGSSAEADAILASQSTLDSLSPKELRAKLKQAAQLMKASGTSKADKRKLRDFIKAGRAQLQKGQSGDGTAAQQQTGGDTQAGAGATTADATTGDFAGLNDKELRQKVRQAVQKFKDANTSPEEKKKLRAIIKAGRAEMDKRGGGKSAGDQASGDDAGGNTAADANSKPADGGAGAGGTADAKAQVFLTDNVDASKLADPDLRKRLQAMRDVLADKSLSKENNRALRKKLATEREFLRKRVSVEEGKKGGGATVTGDNNKTVVNNTTINFYLKDKRPARDLKDDELRVRIRVLRDAERDNKFTEAERRFWRDTLIRDREALNLRLVDLRKKRAGELRAGQGKAKFDLSLNFASGRRPPPYVFAAEADDEDLEDILSAPPRREIKRKYTVEEVEDDPDLRDAVARIEIDTVHFGFGEGFLREEEVDNLDRIAEIMEQILAQSPGEVFLIEGHTDAVGTDSANLQLSRERAASVKKALVTYFVIPEENLKTAGYGERFPKIPTEDPEAENRRVSVARITPLVGALAD